MRALTIILVLLVSGAHFAHADGTDDLIKELNGGDSNRIRNSAALNLIKLDDPSTKVLLALSKAVINDSDADVRATAAAGLGKLGPRAKGSVKGLVIKNLQQAASNDSSDLVKQQANKSLATLGAGGGSTTSGGGTNTTGGGGGIYVNIGPMSSKTGGANDAKLKAMMVKVAGQTLTKSGPHMSQTWPGGPPSKNALAAKKTSGFYVDGTLNTLTVKTSGGGATISCKVSMLLADFPDKNMFGFLNGGASVTAGSSQSDQDMASMDCVQAVIENLIASKIVPTICTKAGGPCP